MQPSEQTPCPPPPPLLPYWAWIKAVNNILSNPPFEAPDEMPVQLTSWLYLSDEYHSIRQIDKLMKKEITHVLSLNVRPKSEWQRTIQSRLAKCNILHKAIGAKDADDYDLIGRHWEMEAKPFLLQAKNSNNGKVLVHCAAGTNRSGMSLLYELYFFIGAYSNTHHLNVSF